MFKKSLYFYSQTLSDFVSDNSVVYDSNNNIVDKSEETYISNIIVVSDTYPKGDINADCFVTEEDAQLLLEYLSGLKPLNYFQKYRACLVTESGGEPDIRDAVAILNNIIRPGDIPYPRT